MNTSKKASQVALLIAEHIFKIKTLKKEKTQLLNALL